MTPETLAALEAAKHEKRPVVLATRLPDGAQRLLPDPSASPELNTAAEQVLQSDESGTVKIDGTDWFLHAHNPPLRLIVVGAVHIAQALVPFATQCGFAVNVVDPRRSTEADLYLLRRPEEHVDTGVGDNAIALNRTLADLINLGLVAKQNAAGGPEADAGQGAFAQELTTGCLPSSHGESPKRVRESG